MLEKYSIAVRNYGVGVLDIRELDKKKLQNVCMSIDAVLKDAFNLESLSSTIGGYLEPLLPPLRHPRICKSRRSRKSFLLNIEYLVHDFGAICRNLEKTSRTVFLDLGASLEFHGGTENPAFSLIDLYSKFGIKFDHYYAYEYTLIPPNRMYESVPQELLPSYHWYNVPVEELETSKRNPWKSILSAYNENDLVIVKLDIDSPEIELPLVHQLMQGNYSRVVDHLYFEHHVKMGRMMYNSWGKNSQGTLQDSLELFTRLREKGISAHSWV
ncbi:unnamed protein product [Cylindrotheca closterium]|uniref:Uncharacterized protein n=1 Tax=Cylindrotheca closterium TaxID=2856 RepID=A0AAD2CUR9_9STRA|nr:unnamed protein product [Cylindrotheca closterium]